VETVLHIVQVVGLFIAATGLLLSALQISRSRAERRAEYVTRVIHRLHDNAELHDVYYELERDQFKFDLAFLGSEKEKRLDKLLEEFDLLARLYKMNVLRVEDINLFWYQFLIVYQNKDVSAYINAVNYTFERSGITLRALEAFREVGELLEKKHGRVQPWRD
jgi:hypothetical protein